MTEGEKKIWAAAYAAAWVHGIRQREVTGIAMSTTEAIESAWAAVVEAREAVDEVREGWGEDHEMYTMLEEMLHD
jgi:hypothetical protein